MASLLLPASTIMLLIAQLRSPVPLYAKANTPACKKQVRDNGVYSAARGDGLGDSTGKYMLMMSGQAESLKSLCFGLKSRGSPLLNNIQRECLDAWADADVLPVPCVVQLVDIQS